MVQGPIDTVCRGFDSVENFAGLDQFFTKFRFRVQLNHGLHQIPRALIEFHISLQKQ